MTILTVLLVAVFFAAWKAPRWVKKSDPSPWFSDS